MDSAGRLDVAVIGAGRVGPVLGAALRGNGHRVVGIAARSRDGAERVGALLPDVPWIPSAEAFAADLVLLAVPDDVLGGLAQELATAVRPGQLVVHTCGLHGLDALAPLTARGALPLALHPAMTFTGTSLDLDRLRGAAVAVTAPAVLVPVADSLVREWGATPVPVAEADRPLYHAALAHGANHLVTLVAQALDALGAVVGAGADGDGDEPAARLLRPLLNAALDNALTSPATALTGPVARGDAGTVARHVRVLADRADADTATVYATLAGVAARRAVAAGRLPADVAARVVAAARVEETDHPARPEESRGEL